MNDKGPKISIIIPSYNQGGFIEQTILSVVNQNYDNKEIIIIDGGSTDNTVEVIKKHESKISYWISEKDKGQSHAINKGFNRSSGDIVCWINSDDVLLPGALKKVADAFLADKSVDVVFGYTIRIDENSRIMFNYYTPKPSLYLYKKGIIYFSQQSWFWKKELFKYVGTLDESLHARMDIDLFLRQVSADVKIKHIKNILAGFRIHKNTKTSMGGEIWTNDLIVMKRRYSAFNYGNPKISGKILYRIIKIFNGDYLKHYLFKNKWQGTELRSFEKSL